MPAKNDEPTLEKINDSVQQVVQTASVSAPVRKYRAVLFQAALIVITGAFAALSFFVIATPTLAIDLQITKAIQQINSPALAVLMNVVSWPGFSPQSLIITAALILLIYFLGLKWEGLMALFAVVLSTGINVLVKDLVHRPRPTSSLVKVAAVLSSFSFPSGHVMFYVTFFGFIIFLVFSLMKTSLTRNFLLVIFGILIFFIGVSRIYLGEHWASDVLGAYLLASLILVAVIQIYRWGKTRFFLHR